MTALRYRFYIATLFFCVIKGNSIYSQLTSDRAPEHIFIHQSDSLNELAELKLDEQPQDAIPLAYESLRISRGIKYQEGEFYAYNNLGLAHDYLGVPDSAYHYFQRAYKLAVALEDDFFLSVAKNNLGMYHLFQKNLPLAFKLLMEALELDESKGLKKDPIISYSNLGLIYEEWGNIDKALHAYKKAAEFALARKTPEKDAFAYLTIGYIASLEKEYEKAIKNYEKALAFYRANHRDNQIAETIFYMGIVRQDQDRLEESLTYFLQALEFYEKQDSKADIVSMYTFIADNHKRSGNVGKALKYYEMAEDLASSHHIRSELVNIYREMANIYSNENIDFKKAHDYRLKYSLLNDTIYEDQTSEELRHLQTSYNLKIKEAENDKLLAERTRDRILLKQRTSFAVSVAIISLLLTGIVVVLYQAYRQKFLSNKQLGDKVRERTIALEVANNKLVQYNEELERFAHISSHDLKEPLRNISSFIHLIQRKLRKVEISPVIEEYMSFVIKGTRQMHELVEDVSAFSKVISTRDRPLESVDLKKVLQELLLSIDLLIRERNALISIHPMPSVLAHKGNFYLIFKNLIENAIKYNKSEQPEVNVFYQSTTHDHHFIIRDNGIGIAEEYQHQIFELFKRLNNREEYNGSGIGLAICKRIIESYGGNIWVESKLKFGSSFHFTLPRQQVNCN